MNDDGEIAGNNRTSKVFDSVYDKYLDSDRIWLGYGSYSLVPRRWFKRVLPLDVPLTKDISFYVELYRFISGNLIVDGLLV